MKRKQVFWLVFTPFLISGHVIADSEFKPEFISATSYYTSEYNWFYRDGLGTKKAPSQAAALKKACDSEIEVYDDAISSIDLPTGAKRVYHKLVNCPESAQISSTTHSGGGTWAAGEESTGEVIVTAEAELDYEQITEYSTSGPLTVYEIPQVDEKCNALQQDAANHVYCEPKAYSIGEDGLQGDYTLEYTTVDADGKEQKIAKNFSVEIPKSFICEKQKEYVSSYSYGDIKIKEISCEVKSVADFSTVGLTVNVDYQYERIDPDKSGVVIMGSVAQRRECSDDYSYGPIAISPPSLTSDVFSSHACFPDEMGADKNLGQPFCMVGNPINTLTGNKYQNEIDIKINSLTLARTYNSMSDHQGMIGNNWRTTLDTKLVAINASLVKAQRANGQVILFTKHENGWKADDDIQLKLTANTHSNEITEEDIMRQVELMTTGLDPSMITPELMESLKQSAKAYLEAMSEHNESIDSYALTTPEWIETYSPDGKLVSLQKRYQPEIWTFEYNDQLKPIKLTSNFGDSVALTWNDNGLLAGFTINDSYQVAYSYHNNLLSKVTTPTTVREYHYEDERHPNALTGISLAGQRYATWAYDEQGRAVSSEHAGGTEKSQLVFNDDSTLVTNAYGKQTRYFFDTIQHVKKPTRVEGAASTHCVAANQNYTYTPEGRTESSTDWNGNITRYQYNDRGLPVSVVQAADTGVAQTQTMTYRPQHDLPIEVITATLKSTFTYNELGQPLVKTIKDLTGHSPDQTTQYQYNEKGLLISIDGPRTDVEDITRFEYNAKGKLVKTINALGHTSEVLSYNVLGQPTKTKDIKGVITEFKYTPGGQLASTVVHGPNGKLTTQYTYDQKGQVKTITDPQGVTLTHHYTPAGYLKKLCNSANECVEYDHDVTGKVTGIKTKSSSNAIVSQQRKTYDELGRLLATVGSNGQQVQYSRDANGNIIAINAATGTTSQHFDALNRLVQQVEPSDTTTNYQHQPQGIGAVEDAKSHTTSFVRDGFGRIVVEKSPHRGVTTYTHDAAGNVTAREDANGHQVVYSYDALNRLINVDAGDNALNVQYAYDQDVLGTLSSITQGDYQASYHYNALGNLISASQTIQGKSYQFTFEYNAKNQQTGITYPSGKTLHLSYDTLGNVSSLSWDGQSIIADINYLAFGPISQWQYGNGLSLTNQYDLDLRLTQKQIGQLINHKYSYDKANRVVSVQNNNQAESFSYDPLSRLLSAKGAYGDLSFSYDKTGNRQTSNQYQYQYAADSQRLTQLVGTSPIDIDYDGNGNIVRYGDKVFHYNSLNRLTQVSERNQVIAEYVYNPVGLRIAKITPDKTTHYLYDSSGVLLAEADTDGSIEREYVSIGLEPVAVIDDESVYYVHTGHLSHPLALTDQAGSVVWQASWKPFGEVELAQEQVTFNLRFPGQYYDAETGLYYNNQRYYSPKLGRYITSDPIGLEGGINTYGYVGQNPLSYIDPEGLAFTPETGWDALNVGVGVAQFSFDVATGNYWGAAVSGVGTAYDIFATAVPFLPGGASMGIKACRGASAVNTAKGGARATEFAAKGLKGGFGPTYRKADSEKLENILTSYYGKVKTGNRVGNGGLADALRHEKATGELLSPSGHGPKAVEMRKRLNTLIRNADNQPPGSYPYTKRDIDFARELVRDLDNAIKF